MVGFLVVFRSNAMEPETIVRGATWLGLLVLADPRRLEARMAKCPHLSTERREGGTSTLGPGGLCGSTEAGSQSQAIRPSVSANMESLGCYPFHHT
jgi:hypothetical protein